MFHRHPMLALTLAVCLWNVPRLQAQAVSGSFVGTVTDPSSAVVPGAIVEFVDAQRGGLKTTRTGADGTYSLPYMLPGQYRMRVQAAGFKTFERSEITLALGATMRVDAQLEVGQTSETVVVTQQAPLLQTDRADVQRPIDNVAVVELPRLGRNYQTALLLIPGAGLPANYWAPENNYNAANTNGNQDAAVNGTTISANSYLMDGVLNKDNMYSGTTVLPPPEAIGDLQIITSNYDAEFGTVGGALVNVTTKSGTNAYHGMAGLFNTNSGLAASNMFAFRKPRMTRNQTVGTLGGPIRKDRTFFFADFQGNNMRIGRAGALYTLPTDDFRRGDFSRAQFPIFDPLTGTANGSSRTPFADNLIPQNRLSPVALKLVAKLPQTLKSDLINNYGASTLFAMDSYSGEARVDHRIGEKTNLFAKYSLYSYTDNDPGIFGDYGGPTGSGAGQIRIGKGRNQGASINATHTFSPTLLAEGRIGFTRRYNNANSPGWDKRIADELGIGGVWNGDLKVTGSLPRFVIPGYPEIGPPGPLPTIYVNENYDLVNNWTKIHSGHTFKWGGDIRRLRGDLYQGNSGTRGAFVFSPAVTASRGGPSFNFANTFASFMLGLPDLIQRAMPRGWPTSIGYQFMFFGQDTWQVTRKLTLNIGVRYELWSAPGARRPGGQANYQPDNNTVLIGGLDGVPLSAGVQWDKNNWAPRIGFAYRPTGKTVVRGGYGISYYAHTFGFYGGTLGGMYPVTLNGIWGVANDYLPEGNINFMPMPQAPAGPVTGVLNPAPDLIFWFIPNNTQFPYVANWNFMIQQALPAKVTLEMGYVGNHGFHQPLQVDFNSSAPGTGAAGRLLFQRFGRTSVTPCRCSTRDSNYNSLQVLAKRRFDNGLYFQAAYTWSRALDNMSASSLYWAPEGYDYGPSGNSHTFVFSHVYELPLGKGKPLLKSGIGALLAGGWSVTGVFVAKTGNFIGVSADASGLQAVGAVNRPDVLHPVAYPRQTGPGTLWFDTTAFARPQPLRFGNAGRNILVGPGLANYDFGILRDIAFNERTGLQIRGEFFNLTNSPHFGNPATSIESPAFGAIASAFGERRIQLGAKLSF